MPHPEYSLSITHTPDPQDTKIINEGLENYNTSMGAPADWLALAVFVRDPDGEVLGGLLGGTYWDWLYVSTLWLDDSVREQGLGSQILKEAENEALRRRCSNAFLDTTSFQALPFYQKQGYTVYAQLDDFPPGHSRYFLKKQLTLTEGE
jgi:GNAT superfamily N-acetyltransferase